MKKDLKTLAHKIADAEKIIQHSEDPIAIEKAKKEINNLSSKITSFEDFFYVDELVQEILVD